jgi:hypothetical protein
MLERGNTADAAMTKPCWAGPRPVATFIAPAMLLAREARLGSLLEILRVSLAVEET